MPQRPGPHDVRPELDRGQPGEHQPDRERRRSYRWEDPAPSGAAARTMAGAQDLSVKFLRAVTTSAGPLRCEGTVIHLGSRTALAQAILTDGTGRQYAHATSSCLIFRP